MKMIKVPATSANVGSGFDCIGIALNLYNTLWFEEIERGISIEIQKQQEIEKIPTDERSLIVKTIIDFYEEAGKKFKGIHLVQSDDIPLTRGLGSSAACIAAGLIAANSLCETKLTIEELTQMAARIEGHPDNVAPAILGGFVVGAMENGNLHFIKEDIPEDIAFIAMTPDFPLETIKARAALPKEISIADTVFNTSRAALLTAAFIKRDWEKLSVACDDKLHQPYRGKMIPHLFDIMDKAKEYGALASFLSGAGPTVIAVIEKNAVNIKENIDDYLKLLDNKWVSFILKADNNGAILYR